MPDQEFKLLITGDASSAVAASQAAGDATKRLKVDTSDLGDETKRSLGLLPDLTDNIKKGGKAAEESGLSHRELRRVLNEIGNTAAPGAGAALGELAFGPVGAALALLTIFEMLRKKLDEDSAAADRLADELAKPDTSGIAGVQKAWDDATKAFGEYQAKLATAGQDNDPIKTEVDRAKQIAIARADGEKKIAEATGDKTGAAYAERKIELAGGSSNLMVEQGLREKAQPGLEQAALAAQQAAEAANKKYADDEKKLASARAATDPTSEAGKALKKKLDDAEEAVDEAKNISGSVYDPLSGTNRDNTKVRNDAIAEAEANQASVKAELENQKREQARLEANEDQRVAAKKTADDAAQKAADAATQNKSRLTQLPGELDQDTQLEDIHQHTRQVTDLLNEHGGRQNETLQQLARSTGKTEEQTLNIVQSIVNGQSTFSQRMAQMEAQLAAMHAQSSAMTQHQY